MQIKSDTKIPYGFAHVEVTNSTDFEVKAIYHTLYHNLLNILITTFVLLTERTLVASYIPQKQTA